MAKFVAATAIDAIEINLKPYVDLEGVIPEPTTDQVTDFQNAFLESARVLGIKPGQVLTPEMAGALDEADASKMFDIVQDAIVGVTGGFITREHLQLLPYRIMTAFIAWLAGELVPEAPTPGSRR